MLDDDDERIVQREGGEKGNGTDLRVYCRRRRVRLSERTSIGVVRWMRKGGRGAGGEGEGAESKEARRRVLCLLRVSSTAYGGSGWA